MNRKIVKDEYHKIAQKLKIKLSKRNYYYLFHNMKSNLNILKSSGNEVIDDFIEYTQFNRDRQGGELEFVPYDQFKIIQFIAEGGFSEIYKAIWVDGPINNWIEIKQNYQDIMRDKNCTVVLKLNNSKNITPEKLNEVLYIQYFQFLIKL
jgi:hypothetical protein